MNQQYLKTKKNIKTYGLSRFWQIVLTLLVEMSVMLGGVALIAQPAHAAVTLGAADLAIVGYNSDASSDDVALIALTDISSGTVIFITDRGWDNNAGTFTVPVTSGETTITWTSPAVSAGTIVNANSLPGTASGSFTELGFVGDQVLIYQTDDDTPNGTPNIIYAFNNNVSTSVPNTSGQWQSGTLSNETTESNLPAGTTEVTSAGGMGNAFGLMGEVDNLVYTGSTTAADKATWLSRIHTPANWTTDNSTPQDIAPGGTNLPTSVSIGNPDTTPPTVSSTFDPAPNAAGWNNSDVTINWNWSDEQGGSGIDTNNCTTSTFLNTVGTSASTAVCSDLAGNSATSEGVIVNLDKTAPDTTITVNPPATSTSSDASFEFTGSDALSGIDRFECSLNITAIAPCTSPHNLTALPNGTYTFTVRATDIAGNVDPTPASYTWTIAVPLSCAAGTYLANPADTSCTDASPGFHVPLADATEQTACAVGTFSATSTAISCTPASPGSFVATTASISQTACALGTFSENAGSVSCTQAEIAFYVDSEGAVTSIACPVNTTTTSMGSTSINDCIPVNSAPVLDAIGNKAVGEGELIEFTVSANDPDTNDILTFQLGNPPTGATLTDNGDDTATFSWTPDFTQAGNFPDVLFTVNDNGVPIEADMETITITVGDTNRPPQFGVLSSQNSDEGVELSFNIQATDPDGNAVTLAVANQPRGALFNDNGNGNGTFTWTPDFDQAGNFTVMFSATDDGAPMQSDTLDVTITIGDVNRVPELSMIGNRAIAEGEFLEFILTASDPDGDNLSYTMDNTPIGATFNDNGDGTATFSWTPGFDQAGNYSDLLFTVTDDGVPAQTDSETITITVGNVNRPPMLSMIGDRTVTEGELLEIILTASDPDGDDLSYSIDNTPMGATFNDNGDGTATFSWMPGFGQAGSFPNVLFGVTDNSAAATETVTFTVITILDQINALKTASWNQVSDRPVRITANAPLAQAIQYYNIAAANYRQNKKSIGDRYLILAVASINKFISTLELGVSKNKFPAAEVLPLLETARSIVNYMQNLING